MQKCKNTRLSFVCTLCEEVYFSACVQYTQFCVLIVDPSRPCLCARNCSESLNLRKQSYTAKWPHRKQCPNLKVDGEWNEVTTKFAEGRVEKSTSLAHLWNDWYGLYINKAKYPRLIVRMEDLVFHAQETTTIVCECVGGAMRKDRPFTYVIDSAKKDSPGHDKTTGFVQAWIKYSKPFPPRGGLRSNDYQDMVEALDKEIMDRFNYVHPLPAGDGKDPNEREEGEEQDGGDGGTAADEHEQNEGKAGEGEEYEA